MNKDGRQFKIAFFGVKSWEREIIEREISKLDTFGVGIFEEEVQDNLGMAAKYDIISPFIYSKFDEKVLNKLPNLKMIATRSTGIDHIDCGWCKKIILEWLMSRFMDQIRWQNMLLLYCWQLPKKWW